MLSVPALLSLEKHNIHCAAHGSVKVLKEDRCDKHNSPAGLIYRSCHYGLDVRFGAENELFLVF